MPTRFGRRGGGCDRPPVLAIRPIVSAMIRGMDDLAGLDHLSLEARRIVRILRVADEHGEQLRAVESSLFDVDRDRVHGAIVELVRTDRARLYVSRSRGPVLASGSR